MKLDRLGGVAFAAILSSFVSQSALGQNLLSNPGFETGNFNGWTLSGSTDFEGVSASFSTAPNSGSYSAFFGAVGTYNIISQTIATTPGHEYNLSFALDDSGGAYSEAYMDWGGAQVLDIQPGNPFGWTEFGVDVVATSDTTTVSFGFEQDPSYFNLDDTSLVDLTDVDQSFAPVVNAGNFEAGDPDPSKVPDQGVGLWASAATFVGLCAVARQRRRQRTC